MPHSTQELKNKIKGSTNDLFTHLSDWVLFLLWMITDSRLHLLSFNDVVEVLLKIEPRLSFVEKESLLHSIQRIKKEGWLSNDFKINKRGGDRLFELVPQYLSQRAWSKQWHLLIFDIPENEKYKRELLRRKIKNMRFGMLQASIWISPYDKRQEIRAMSLRYSLDPYIIQCLVSELEGDSIKEVATRVWKLDELNERYKAFISLYQDTGRRLIAPHIFLDYKGILNKDPQLPFELLPRNWKGREAHRLFKKIYSKAKKRLVQQLEG